MKSEASHDTRNIGSRREPFVDEYLVEKMKGVELRLGHPVPQDVVLRFDKPWEGNTCGYYVVFKDGDLYRLYYRGSFHDPFGKLPPSPQVVCYAESTDGIRWRRKDVGLYRHGRSKRNNIVWTGKGNHNFAPFKDTNPACKPSERYKALGGARSLGGLFAFKSADGMHWDFMSKKPVITNGAFDSQNLAFWDGERGCYLDFHRDFRKRRGEKWRGERCIKTCRSSDFLKWSRPAWLDYGDAPREQLYTNAITPMPGCEHILVGFPKRFVPNRKRVEEDKGGVSDGVFMSSRDGRHWRRWTEAFIRPGPVRDAWFNRNNMPGWGLVPTKARRGDETELSMFVGEAYYTPRCRLRRWTLRQDGFVSVRAGSAQGELLTRPLRFEGNRLCINFATSAAGSVRVEVRDAANKPIKGHALRDCPELYGDALNECVHWRGGVDVGALAGKPVRLRFVMQDADLYALQFGRGG